ncbi:ATPase [Flavobacterium magnum]|uniref:ATPase n=1 Tax=Flavobacterium magnum TaxID=2162713 RepID=A0A2S0RFH4_9FLAO|nr:SRPBCC domain-containing protein [Flavobacterium magnum]AWA30279.1 ATPase [Flavobacterium magnum]
MKNFQTDFTVDKESNKIHVKRTFAAPVSTVWKAWTTSEILDQWWAPKPYRAQTKSMDFREGGSWFYSMLGPQGDEHRCRADYKTVEVEKSFTGLDAFCDENWNTNHDFPRTDWHVTFRPEGNHTFINVTLTYEKPEDLEMIMSMGFKEGFTAALTNLDALLQQ